MTSCGAGPAADENRQRAGPYAAAFRTQTVAHPLHARAKGPGRCHAAEQAGHATDIAGGLAAGIAAGADLPLYLLQDILGLEITTDGSFQENLLMMRYPAAKYTQVHDPKSLPGFDTPLSL